MHQLIVKCYVCSKQMTEFEKSKFFKLQDYWGGRKEVKPKCVNCYHKELDTTIRRAGGHSSNKR